MFGVRKIKFKLTKGKKSIFKAKVECYEILEVQEEVFIFFYDFGKLSYVYFFLWKQNYKNNFYEENIFLEKNFFWGKHKIIIAGMN